MKTSLSHRLVVAKVFMSFKTSFKIHFDEADPAGIAFSGIIFTKAHRCFEKFIEEITQDAHEFFLNSETIYPIRHTETEFMRPFFPLKEYEARVSVVKIGDSSFQLQFELGLKEQVHAVVRTTHVCCDKKTMGKKSLPSRFRESLKSFEIPQ